MSETVTNADTLKTAVLIDAENVSPDLADQIFTSAATRGTIVVREIYGTAAALNTWIQPVLKYAIHPNLTVKASKGKNSSDISLVIGAMDLLSYREISTVVIVSSDSDFSSLSVRLRSDGINVVGMGAEKANPLWRTSCTSFVVLNEKKPTAASSTAPAQKPAMVRTAAQPAAAAPAAATTAKNPTHEERLNNIRERIAALLKAEKGPMSAAKLFQNLNKFHDYQVDQAGSKRKPLNYLKWAFGNTFFFEETPNGMLISLEPFPKAQEKAAEAEPAAQPTDTAATGTEKELPKAAESIPQEAAKPAGTKAEEPAKNHAESQETEPKTKAEQIAEPPKAEQAAESPEADTSNVKQDEATEAKDQKADKPAASAKKSAAPKAKASGRKSRGTTGARAQSASAEPDPGLALIVDMKEIPARIRKALIASGRATLRDAAQVSDEELNAIPQVGAATIAAFRKAVDQLLGA